MARKIIKFNDALREELKDPVFRKHWEDYELPVKLAIEIALLRKRKKLTQAQLAKKMGVKQQMVAQWENPEKKSTPNLRTLQRVADALDAHLYVGFQ